MKDTDCRQVFERLSEYLNRELPEGDCAELEKHIRDCEPCVAFVESLKKSVQLCGSYQPVEPPPALSPQARQSLLDAYQRMLAARRSTP